MHSTDPLAESLRSYTAWAERLWTFPQHVCVTQSAAEMLVLVLGLGGEASELLEEVLALDRSGVPHANLVKELGDVAYNWARVAQLSGFDTVELLQRSGRAPVPADVDALCLAARLMVAAGSLLEAYKKQLRDGALNHDKVEAGLLAFIKSWQELCALLAQDPVQVLALNRTKLDSRYAAGTLGGSGNDR